MCNADSICPLSLEMFSFIRVAAVSSRIAVFLAVCATTTQALATSARLHRKA